MRKKTKCNILNHMIETKNSCNVELEFNPLGDLLIKWEIPTLLLKLRTKYSFELPGFKYDLPKFLSIPVPFSSKSIKLKTEIISKTDGLNIEISKAKYGNLCIEIEPEKLSLEPNSIVKFEFKISNILNADGVYFVAVFPFRTPFEGQIHNIIINCKFSYNIRRYSFWERYFEYPSNRKLNNKPQLQTTKIGDELNICGTILGNEKHTIDIHITGTRFPVYIRRDIFWLIVFFISACVFLSPFISEIINLFKSTPLCGESTNCNFTLFKF